jgi:hypothetical protein
MKQCIIKTRRAHFVDNRVNSINIKLQSPRCPKCNGTRIGIIFTGAIYWDIHEHIDQVLIFKNDLEDSQFYCNDCKHSWKLEYSIT